MSYIGPAKRIFQIPTTDEYRGFVGPADTYDERTEKQLGMLLRQGLNKDTRFLDFGCGCLRSARLLIPFLKPNMYYGIEPNLRILNFGLEREVPPEIIEAYSPMFSDTADCDLGIFGVRFDMIFAQCVFNHCGPDQLDVFLSKVAESLAPNGCVIMSIRIGEKSGAVDWAPNEAGQYSRGPRGKRYPHSSHRLTYYTEEAFVKKVQSHNLVWEIVRRGKTHAPSGKGGWHFKIKNP